MSASSSARRRRSAQTADADPALFRGGRLHPLDDADCARIVDAAFSILEQVGYAQAYVYGIVDAPWPMQDRDTVVRFDYQQNPQTREILITIVNFPDHVPHEPGFVRVPDFGGFWRLRPLPQGEVAVTYQVHGAPGGWVPVWMANYAAAVSVNRTLHNLPAAVERYRGARSQHVLEPQPEP